MSAPTRLPVEDDPFGVRSLETLPVTFSNVGA
jgi:hypothetical protein